MLPYVFDFDGVLHKDPVGDTLGEVDFTPIDMAQERGIPAVVMTCNPMLATYALTLHGFSIYDDTLMECWSWSSVETVLVTRRKIVAAVYFDDKALNARYGQDWEAAFEEAARMIAERELPV